MTGLKRVVKLSAMRKCSDCQTFTLGGRLALEPWSGAGKRLLKRGGSGREDLKLGPVLEEQVGQGQFAARRTPEHRGCGHWHGGSLEGASGPPWGGGRRGRGRGGRLNAVLGKG